MVVRSVEDHLARLAALHPDRLAGLRVDQPHPEIVRRGDLHEFLLRHAHDALDVAREHPMEACGRQRTAGGRLERRRRNGKRRLHRAVPICLDSRIQALDFAGSQRDAAIAANLRFGKYVEGFLGRETAFIPLYPRRSAAIEIREDEEFAALDGERIALAARHQLQMRGTGKLRVGVENRVQLGDEIHHVRLRAPIEVVLAVDVDLLLAEPLDAIGDAPCALPGKERRQLHAQFRVGFAALREPVVVVGLGKVDEGAERLAAADCSGQIPLELAAVVSLEDFRIRPIEVGLAEERVGDFQFAAEAFEHEDGVGIFLAHPRHDIFPCLERNHVAGIAAEAVHAIAAPEEEHVGHIGAKFGIGVVQLHKIRPHDAPGAGARELPVGGAPEPVGMVRLQRRRPAGMVCGQVHEEKPLARMHGIDEFLELVERRRVFVELRHRGIYRQEIERRERAAVFAHDRVGGRHRERRQGLDDPEPHPVHDERQPARHFAETAELAGEYRVDGVVLAGFRALHLDMEVRSVRPFRHIGIFREEARFTGEYPDFPKPDLQREDAGGRLLHRDVGPGLRKRHFAALGLGDDFGAAHLGVADVAAERRPPFARIFKLQLHLQDVAAPLEQKASGFRKLRHGLSPLPSSNLLRSHGSLARTPNAAP